MRQFIIVILLAIVHLGHGGGELGCDCNKPKPTEPKSPEPKKLSAFVVGA